MILEYPPIAAPEKLREWKIAIISVGQEYEFTEGQQDYKTETETTYRERGAPIDIRKAKDNFNKDGKLNCNVYRHMTKNCKKPKKKQDVKKYYKCDKIGHITKDCRSE